MATVQTYVFVWRGDGFVPAGLLTIDPDERFGGSRFSYGRRYLARRDRIAIDPASLPIADGQADREFATTPGLMLFGAIDDATPDGWGQYLMYKALGDRLPNAADLVLASGERRIGALAFGPTPQRAERITPWGETALPGETFSLETLLLAAERAQDEPELDEGLRSLLNATSSLGGARPKATTLYNGAEWIAKFPRKQDTYPECRVELAAMRLAAACGLDVPALDFVNLLGRDIYLIRRFDRAPGTPERLPFVSALTMLAAHESEAPRFAYADLAGAIRRFGTRIRRDLHELFDRMAFNVLVTNDDDHPRNHGFLHDGKGWNLSPLFDVVPKPQVGLDRRLVLGVGPAGRSATLANALAGARHFDLTPDEAKARVLGLAGKVRAGWEAAFREAGIGAADRGRFATCFREADPAVHGIA